VMCLLAKDVLGVVGDVLAVLDVLDWVLWGQYARRTFAGWWACSVLRRNSWRQRAPWAVLLRYL